MIRAILSLYSPGYPNALVYMLQSTEYQIPPYLKWYWRTTNFAAVAKRRQLEPTRSAILLLRSLRLGMALQVAIGLVLIQKGLNDSLVGGIQLGIAAIISYPVLWAHAVILPLLLGRLVIIWPQQRRLIKQSRAIFSNHHGKKIAVAGSYGKTTMKELLQTILSEGKKVAATPGNKNVSVSHGAFARRLKGDEDILVIEYGEGRPGDVARFTAITKPDIGIITGIAPAHLDKYKTLQAAGEDIFGLADYLNDKSVYVNGESPAAQDFVKPAHVTYSSSGVDGWKVSDVKIAADHTAFKLRKGSKSFNLKTGLVGRHQIGPLSLAAAIASELGLSKAQIEKGMSKTKPYEHRMQPYILGGARVIDDTYNGNIEGVRAGLELLKEVKAKRKLYITPGLVDQGTDAAIIHQEMGELIAKAKPDNVVLMKNSVTEWIQSGLDKGGYKGQVTIESNPLNFYINLRQFVASGDLVLMQNDWTDNYN